jgi:predicted nuclease of restriction endonuclease-like (RecB) superfamily
MVLEKNTNKNYIVEIKQILENAKQNAYTTVNSIMVRAYWLVGRRIIVEEQNGKKRAEYGKQIIKTLSKELSLEFDKSFSERRIREIRQFYLTFPSNSLWHLMSAESNNQIWHSLSAEFKNSIEYQLFTRLSWTHIRHLLRVSNPEARNYYIKETAENSWAVSTLERNISSQYYERLLLSHSKECVKKEMEEKTKEFQIDKMGFIKNPAVLEFLNLPANTGYTECELEKAIINNLHHFLLELGKGYAFVERQQLIRTDARDYYIDLVFYNFILKCFVLIDLKTKRITHQDVGQMDMYVRMYDEEKKFKDDNPTIGIVLCSETDHDIAKYSILKGNEQIFASKYKLYLPSEEELRAEIEREKLNFKLQMDNVNE